MAYQPQQPMQPMFQQDNGGEWKNSLCDCSPCDSCMISFCVPCILVGRTTERLRDPTMQTAESMNNDCLIHGGLCFFTGCHWIYTMLKRGEIRERFGIPGSGFGDCCVTYWCHCCAVIQQDNEVKTRMRPTGPIDQQYQPLQQGMVMPQGPPPAHAPPQKEGYTHQ
ncbi:uncharacterized protein JN550_006455 [Neoarthrinium moseri]|uniref:uncharacterized protein n=1 Tax=Neoarthrinium moseri TaxID=1658444 RepID=UPI001FDDB84D|nr:uncharacterized protein JN550_006455 [Neoarthrinium moseri]KAI1868539.1 hypothetical protein JN550_006455 [Neoarthrinium moseri]